MLLQCAKCGKDLSADRTILVTALNLPPSCEQCEGEVYEETERDMSMWPSDWHGHASINSEGRWYELPSDDGDYDIVEQN